MTKSPTGRNLPALRSDEYLRNPKTPGKIPKQKLVALYPYTSAEVKQALTVRLQDLNRKRKRGEKVKLGPYLVTKAMEADPQRKEIYETLIRLDQAPTTG